MSLQAPYPAAIWDSYRALVYMKEHAKVWNTRRNHLAWKLYLRSVKNRTVSQYASPSRCKNYEDLPPAYTFVGDAEPFYCETLDYIENLQAAGVTANVDVYPGGYHAFDLMEPDDLRSIRAAEKFCEAFLYAKTHYFAPQEKQNDER
jgi:acetyl esterase/lipase